MLSRCCCFVSELSSPLCHSLGLKKKGQQGHVLFNAVSLVPSYYFLCDNLPNLSAGNNGFIYTQHAYYLTQVSGCS